MSAMKKERLCPCCKRVLTVRRWKMDNQLYGEERRCPDMARCNYSSSWTVDERSNTIKGVTLMRSSSIKSKTARDQCPKNMVPGGDA
jgi:hypothetical protein